MIKIALKYSLILGFLIIFQSCNKNNDLILEECDNEKALNYGEKNPCKYSSTIKIKKAIVTSLDSINFIGFFNQPYDSVYLEIFTDNNTEGNQPINYYSEKIFYFPWSQNNYDSLVYDLSNDIVFNPFERGNILSLRLKGHYNGYQNTDNLSNLVEIDLNDYLYFTNNYNNNNIYPLTLQINDSNEFEATLFFEWL